VQGAGWLTTEELVWDGKGRLATHAPSPTRSRPVRTGRECSTSALWNRPNPEAAVGKSKAVGEPPFNLGISAFLALPDAVAKPAAMAASIPTCAHPPRPRPCWMPSAGCGAMFDLTALQGAVAAHGQVARLVIAGMTGPLPREVGAAMLVWAGGQSGTIGGGALEFEAVARARACWWPAGRGWTASRWARRWASAAAAAVTLLTEIYDAATVPRCRGRR
jgi:hypothetical protein